MKRMTSIAALTCAFAFAALSPALSQYEGKNPVKGIETDAQIDKKQEEMRKQDASGRSSANQPASQSPGEMGSGKEESNIVREGVEPQPQPVK